MSPVFTWKISDPTLLSKIKESKATESFKSDPFTAFGLNWHFELFPNGSKKSNMGQIELFIALQSIPNGISTIILNTKLTLIETDTIMSTKMVITNATMNQQTSSSKPKPQPASWYYGPKIDKILNLNQLTFKYEAQLINIKLLNNNKDITEQWLESPSKAIQNHLSPKSRSIPATSNSKSQQRMIPMRVPSHNRMSPTTTTNTASLSPHSSEYHGIEIQFAAYKEHINNTMQQWALQVNKRFARMEKEINSMRKAINANLKMNGNTLSSSDNNEVIIISEKEHNLKIWLRNTVKLPQYYDVFINNGINDLWVVMLLGMDDIKEMKINKIGHRLQLMHHIKELKQNQQSASKSPSSVNLSVGYNGNAFFDDDNDNNNGNNNNGNNHNHNKKRQRKGTDFNDQDLEDKELTNDGHKSLHKANPAKKQRIN